MLPWKTPQQRQAAVKRMLRWAEHRHKEPAWFYDDVPWHFFLEVGPEEIAQAFAALPIDALEKIEYEVANAPRSEEDWDEWFVIVCGAYRCSVQEMSDAIKKAFREAVELLRERFETEGLPTEGRR